MMRLCEVMPLPGLRVLDMAQLEVGDYSRKMMIEIPCLAGTKDAATISAANSAKVSKSEKTELGSVERWQVLYLHPLLQMLQVLPVILM